MNMIDEPLTSGIPDSLSTLRPAGEADYRQVELEIRKERAVWAGHLRSARQETKLVLGLTSRDLKSKHDEVVPIQPGAARSRAMVAFWDILVFFGVLMVGFAYVWRRGDLNWIKTVSHRGGEHPVGQETADQPKAVA